MGFFSFLTAKPSSAKAPTPAATPLLQPTPMINAELLAKFSVPDAKGWALIIANACTAKEITTRPRIAAFLANVFYETGRLAMIVENLNYSAISLENNFSRQRISIEDCEKLGRTSDHPANQEAIANTIYGGAWGAMNLGNKLPGDGWKFRGRGLIQLTGRANYQHFGDIIGVSADNLPVLLETREGAAESATHFWQKAGLNKLADQYRITDIRQIVNGGDKGLVNVQTLYQQLLTYVGTTGMAP